MSKAVPVGSVAADVLMIWKRPRNARRQLDAPHAINWPLANPDRYLRSHLLVFATLRTGIIRTPGTASVAVEIQIANGRIFRKSVEVDTAKFFDRVSIRPPLQIRIVEP